MITDYFCIVVSMKRSQSGFSIVEGVLIFAIIVLLAFAGWYVFNKNNKQNSSDANTKSSSSNKDSSHRYIRDPGSPETWENAKDNQTVISPDEKGAGSGSVTINFSLCSVGQDEFGFGSGSTSFYFEGIKDNKCHFYMGTEVENPRWDGHLDEECFVPINHAKVFSVGSGGSLTFEKDYCKT
jgi:hypothetical protein